MKTMLISLLALVAVAGCSVTGEVVKADGSDVWTKQECNELNGVWHTNPSWSNKNATDGRATYAWCDKQ